MRKKLSFKLKLNVYRYDPPAIYRTALDAQRMSLLIAHSGAPLSKNDSCSQI